MFFDERNKKFVRKWTRLAKFWIGANDDPLFGHATIEFNLLCMCGRSFGVMAEQSSCDTQQRVLHVELVCLLNRLCPLRCPSGFRHTSGYYSGKKGGTGGRCPHHVGYSGGSSAEV